MSYWRDEHDNECAKLYWPGLAEPLYLEEECWSCKGVSGKTGSKYPYNSDDGKCEWCNSKGYRLTESGKAVLALLKRWGDGR